MHVLRRQKARYWPVVRSLEHLLQSCGADAELRLDKIDQLESVLQQCEAFVSSSS